MNALDVSDPDPILAEPPLDENGFLMDPTAWTEPLGEWLAHREGVAPLGLKHWAVIQYVRAKYRDLGALPTLRLICRETGLPRDEILELFSACQSLWRIAGLPNPGEEALAHGYVAPSACALEGNGVAEAPVPSVGQPDILTEATPLGRARVLTGPGPILAEELLDENGFLLDPTSWSEELGKQLAHREGLTRLTLHHWTLIHYIRVKYQALGGLPTLRLICRDTGLPRAEILELFNSCQSLWRVAGLPNPGAEALAHGH